MTVPRSNQGTKTLWVAVLLAAVLIERASSVDQERLLEPLRLLQDKDVQPTPPSVGVGFAAATGGSRGSTSSSVEDDLVHALEQDDQVTGARDTNYSETSQQRTRTKGEKGVSLA